MTHRFKYIWQHYQQLILYSIFGILTFLVDTGLFFIFSILFELNDIPWLMHSCSIVSTISAITFAYITNRKYVFKSKASSHKDVLKEISEFYIARGFTMILAEILLHITVVVCGLSAPIMKLAVNVIVIVLNYVFSKLWIFKGSNEKNGTAGRR